MERPNENAWAVMARGGAQPMKEMHGALTEAGIDARLVPPEGGAGKG